LIDYAIRTTLLAAAGVTTYTGTGANARIYPVVLPQRPNPVWPALTYQIISGRPEYHINGVAGVAECRVQIDCWSAERAQKDAYNEVRLLAEAVRAALSAFTGTVGSDVVQSCFLENRRSLYDDETKTHRESMDFMVGYTES